MILALDLGTKTGWAFYDPAYGDIPASGSELLYKVRQPRVTRWLNFKALLARLQMECRTQYGQPIDVVVYEEIRRHQGTRAAHIYGAFEAILELWANSVRAELVPMQVGTIKKKWTGSGSAKKIMMMAVAERLGYAPADDNEADAIAIASVYGGYDATKRKPMATE